jgi:hypothetical protein
MPNVLHKQGAEQPRPPVSLPYRKGATHIQENENDWALDTMPAIRGGKKRIFEPFEENSRNFVLQKKYPACYFPGCKYDKIDWVQNALVKIMFFGHVSDAKMSDT